MELPIADIVQAGIAFDLKRSAMTGDLRPVVERLFDELRATAVEYLLGGVALLSYVEGRNTQDIDLIVGPDDLGKIAWSATVQDRDFGRASFHGIRVDLLLRTNPLFDRVATHHRATVELAGRSIDVASRTGLLLLKLYALPSLYRRGELARAALYETDVLMLHQGAEVDDAAILEELRAFLEPHDVAELAGILAEQRARKRFER